MLEAPSQRLAEIDRIFDEALNLEPNRRNAFLTAVAVRDPALAAEVERLLDAEAEHDASIDVTEVIARAWSTLLGDQMEDDRDRPIPEGARFGAYRIVGEIARGGMATVYLAERADGAFDQRVALKLLPLAFADAEARRRLHRERKILAQLQHPNICRLLDGGSDEWGRPFLVMEFVDGVPIDRYCDEQMLGIDERVRLLVAVAEAVAFAHRNLIVHRDLKPSNILVTPEGRVKLLDFGIAKLLDPEEADGPTVGRMMTPAWASPEQLRGEPLSTSSDVYQLGLLLRELLAGRRPAAAERERARRSRTPRGDLDVVVSKALEIEPAARYASVQAFAEDLERHLARRPILARPQTFVYRSSRFLRRHRLGAVAAAIAMTAIVAGAAIAAYQAVVAARERTAAERAAHRAARVADFLVEVFEGSAPERALGREITARELLDRGAARIEQLNADPQLKASLLETMGRAYRSHGVYDRSTELFERALADRRAVASQAPNALAATLHDLGTVMHYQSRFDTARTYFDQALALRRAAGNADLPGIADTLHQRGAMHIAAGDNVVAERDLHEALDLLRRHRGPQHPSVAAVLTDLGRLLAYQGRVADATPVLTEAVKIRREALGTRHPAYAESLVALARNLETEGRMAEALVLFREGAEIDRDVYGPNHPTTLNRANALGTRLFERGEYAEAATLFRRVHDGSRARLGEGHALMGSYAFNIGATCVELGEFEEAERYLRRALAIQEATTGREAWNTLMTVTQLAVSLFRMGQHGEAERLFTRALASVDRVSFHQESVAAAVRLGYGRLLLDTGRTAAAAPLVETGVENVRSRYGEASWRTAVANVVLGKLRFAQRRRDEARRLWTEALDLLSRERPRHRVTSEVRSLLAEARL
jgi:serine/threonine-protein kinase